MYTNLLQFISDHPWISFFMAWPTALVLVSVAWLIASVLDNAYKLSIALVSQLMTCTVTLVRGYPPKPKSAFEELFGAPPEKFESGEKSSEDEASSKNNK